MHSMNFLLHHKNSGDFILNLKLLGGVWDFQQHYFLPMLEYIHFTLKVANKKINIQA